MDNKLKTQVLLKIIVPAGISKAELEGLLSVLSREQLETQGYKYRRSPTHIAIYAYVDREYAADGSGWVGRLMRMGEPKTDIIVNEQLLNAQSKPPEVKDGIPEDARRRMFWDMAAAEDRAQREAQQTGVSIRQESELKRSLKEKYQRTVLAKHKITASQWANIRAEGHMKRWPIPWE